MPTQTAATPQAIVDYPLDERRTDRYTFTTLKALEKYFRAWLPKDMIREQVERAKVGFVRRADASDEETRLQLIKKCEYMLVRLLRSGVAAMAY